MQEDRLIGASSSEWFAGDEPLDQKKERNDERSEVLKEYPQIRKVIDNLREQAQAYGDVEQIPKDIRLDATKCAIRLDSMAETKANLLAVATSLEALLIEHS